MNIKRNYTKSQNTLDDYHKYPSEQSEAEMETAVPKQSIKFIRF